MDDMPPLQEGRVYQAWVVYDGRSVSLGVMPHEPTVSMKADLQGATMFAITDEPMGGSAEPSGPLVAMAEFD
jgi:anti-sigma-K factor RskA